MATLIIIALELLWKVFFCICVAYIKMFKGVDHFKTPILPLTDRFIDVALEMSYHREPMVCNATVGPSDLGALVSSNL